MIALAVDLRAQCIAPTVAPHDIVSVGSPADERLRDDQLRGRCPTAGTMIRSAAASSRPLALSNGVRWVPILPRFETTFNSQLPLSLNDGPQWAGRGLTTALSGGVRVQTERLSAAFVPQIVYAQNRPFFVFPSRVPGRSVFASPWHGGIESADLPLRFGDQPIATIFPGESWIEWRGRYVAGGGSTENLWWGPGLKNGLLLSNNAAGIPQIYARTSRPIATPIGDVEARVFLGVLTESRFFDDVAENDYRSISAAVATLRVPFDTGLTVGLARAVYGQVGSLGGVVGRVGDFAFRWNQTADTLTRAPSSGSDQIMSAFLRWVVPAAGVEVYGEWATLFVPGLRQVLVAPDAHQGITVGFQWLKRVFPRGDLRLQLEATTLDQNPPTAGATIPIFYTSRFSPQGYTQRGQIIGAAIGPGGSSQWVAADYLGRMWRFGGFFGRMRVEDEVMYRRPGARFSHHDVTVYSGARVGARFPWADVAGELAVGRRYNYLFQTDSYNAGDVPPANAIDVQNVTFRLRITP